MPLRIVGNRIQSGTTPSLGYEPHYPKLDMPASALKSNVNVSSPMANILEPFGYTPEHTAAVADMDKNFTGSQFDYAAASTKDMVDRASNPLTATISAVGNVVGRPVYDFVDAAKEYSKKGYQGEFSLSPQGAVDFVKNVGALGKEFYDQKPHVMMAGATKGGLEALAEHYGFTHAMADDGWTIYPDSPITEQNIQRPNITKLIQMSRRRQQLQDFKNIEAKTAAEAAKQKAAAEAAADARKKQRMSDKQYDDWRRHNDAGYGKTADEKLAMTGGTEEWGEDMMGGTEAPGNGNVSAETGTDFGPSSHMIARGGLAQHAPRYANGGLIDFFRYGGFIG